MYDADLLSLTEESFDWFQDVIAWRRRIGERKLDVVERWKILVLVRCIRVGGIIGGSQQTVLEQANRVSPGLVRAVN